MFSQLDRLHAAVGVTVLIHGAADHVDTFAGEWARDRGVPEKAYPMMPGEGGFARNGRMLIDSEPELVVHFPGGNGTRDMVRRAVQAGVATMGGLERMDAQEGEQLELGPS